jgi:hypothetical protein
LGTFFYGWETDLDRPSDYLISQSSRIISSARAEATGPKIGDLSLEGENHCREKDH